MIVHIRPSFLLRWNCTVLVSVHLSMALEVTEHTSPVDVKVIRYQMSGRKRGSSGERGMCRIECPLDFKNIENYFGRLRLLVIIPLNTVPRRALKAVAEQQVQLETISRSTAAEGKSCCFKSLPQQPSTPRSGRRQH